MRFSPILALAAAATASNLFVSDYNGNITTISLTEVNGTYALNTTRINASCGPNPSWLTINPAKTLLFCVNEGFATVNGSLTSFSINADGSLALVSNLTTPAGPVNVALYANSRGLALAHYGGAAISTYTVSSSGNLTTNEEIFFPPSANGTVVPHPHQAVLDPTGKYIVVPDLGSDLVRVFSFDNESLKLKALDPLKAAPGSGPRHLAFWNPYGIPGGTTFMYLVHELAATVTSYAVHYGTNSSGFTFQNISTVPATGDYKLPRKNAPAEIRISPDNRFLIVSNRNETAFTIDGVGKSDSISTFHLGNTGNMSTIDQLWPAGGSFPRSFEMNTAGDLVAVGLQNSQSVVILKRDVACGKFQKTVASIPIAGNVTAVVWG